MKWANALEGGSVEEITKLYEPRAIMIPALSNKVYPDDSSKFDYYTSFLSRSPKVELLEDWIDTTACNTAQYVGIQLFTFTDPVDGTKIKTKDRFHFVFKTVDGNSWQIVTHHNSQMPNEVGGG